jgi:hypothetical protein
MGVAPRFPYDLASGAKHLDFTSPEAYIISGKRKSFLQGGFNVAYGRLVSGGKPVYWAECGTPVVLGVSVPEYNHGRTPENHKQEAEFYHSMMQLCEETCSNAVAGWWWPGGFRISENSDFGIINPDRTPRAAAMEIRKASKRLNTPRERPQPSDFIIVDRDKYVSGYAGLYAELAGKYAEILVDGGFPGVRTAGTGTTSVNAPLIAVGNTRYNGHNPPKYLNAEFNTLRIDGQPVTNNAVIEVERGKPVRIEASVGNTAEAAWVAPKAGVTGEVYLLAESGDEKVLLPIEHDTRFLCDAAIVKCKLSDGIDRERSFVLKMVAKGRAEFGEVMHITLKPIDI